MGHYDTCYEADAQDEAKKKHKEIRKELIELINKLDDNQRKLLIRFIKNIDTMESMISFFKQVTK